MTRYCPTLFMCPYITKNHKLKYLWDGVHTTNFMKTYSFFKPIAIMAIISILITGCGSTKKAASGYVSNQTRPTTDAQAAAANRGLKLQREECEEMALAATDKLRAAGNAQSDSESFATNLAMLDARSNLAQQIEVLVFGMLKGFDQQHKAGESTSSVAKAGQLQNGYFNQFLNNTRPIGKNTYVKEDGSYNVYVCIEMSEEQQKAVHRKLTEDQIIGIDYQEYLFMQDMAKAKEEYRQKQLTQ